MSTTPDSLTRTGGKGKSDFRRNSLKSRRMGLRPAANEVMMSGKWADSRTSAMGKKQKGGSGGEFSSKH